MTFWQMLQAGGVTLYVLFLFSILSMAIIIERLLYYKKISKVKREEFVKNILSAMRSKDSKKVLKVCGEVDTPFSHVVYAGLSLLDYGPQEIAHSMERTILLETVKLEKRLNTLATIGSTAVYVGLFGTVLGIIKAFNDIAHTSNGGINVVIHGISEALVCTAAGLCVAVPAVMAYNYFVKRVDGFVIDMELCASEITDAANRIKDE